MGDVAQLTYLINVDPAVKSLSLLVATIRLGRTEIHHSLRTYYREARSQLLDSVGKVVLLIMVGGMHMLGLQYLPNAASPFLFSLPSSEATSILI